MNGQRVGYVRVSSPDQNPDRQIEGINDIDTMFIEKASAKNMERPELQAMLRYVRSGDTVVVHSMDRLARNLEDLLSLVNEIINKGARVEFIKENLVFNGEDSSMSKLVLSIMGAVAEFERKLIAERRSEGLRIAKAKGIHGGRPPAISKSQLIEIKKMLSEGATKVTVAKEFGISRKCLYKHLEVN